MALYDNKCPSCDEVIPQRKVPARQSGSTGFPCPACGRRLRTSRLPLSLTLPATFAVSTALTYYFGLRHATAVIVSIVLSLPLFFVIYVVIGLMIAPPLELFPGEDNRPGTGGEPLS